MTDALTTRAAAAGDPAALTTLIAAYQHRVHRFAVRACRDEYDADDAVQEAFIKLSNRPDVAAHPSALAWLMTVIRNACLRLMRPLVREKTRLGRRVDTATDVRDPADTPEQALARFRLAHTVHVAIAELAAPYREVIVLRDLEGMSGSEVCEALGIGEAAMKSRLNRARRQVRDALIANRHLET